MNKYSQKSSKRLEQLFDEHLFPILKERIENEISTLNTIQENLDQFLNGKRDVEEKQSLLDFNTAIYSILKERHSEKPNRIFQEDFPELFQKWEMITEDLQPVLILEQSPERFRKQAADRWMILLFKSLKRFFFHITRLPHYTVNGFRALFKKPKKKIKYWQYNLPLRNLATYHFHSMVLKELNPLFIEAQKLICTGFNQQRKIEETLTSGGSMPEKFDGEKEIVDSFKQIVPDFEEKVKVIIKEKCKAFDDEFLKAGTLELISRNFRAPILSKRWKEGQISYKKSITNWDNTIFALFEEWRTDLELLKLKYLVEMEYGVFKRFPEEKFSKEIQPKIKQIDEFIKESLDVVKESKDLRKCLVQTRYKAVKQLDQDIIPRFGEILASKNLHGQIDRLEKSIIDHLEKVSEKRAAVETNDYDVPLEDGDLNQISLNELISFDMLPKLKSNLAEMRSNLFNEIGEVTNDVNGMDQIIIFTLTSSINSLEKEEKSDEEIKLIVSEGFDRANQRLKEVEERLKIALNGINDQTEQSVSDFLSNVVQLMDAENIINIRIRLTKAKALAQSEQYKQRITERVLSWAKTAKTFSLKKYQEGQEYAQPITQIFFPKQSESVISKETVDFLNDSQQVIDRLPLIYRRLYEIEPLEDMELFEGRTAEIANIEEAYTSWKAGNFAATVIIGEKWGGNTTFINYATSKIKFDERVLRMEIKQNLQTEKELIECINQPFSGTKHDSLVEFVEYLTSDNIRRVIILEDIQNLYLRKIDGFKLLQRLFELITQTSKHVFWVCTSTVYAWRYLKNVIQIDDYFNITIELGEMSNEQIINVIAKRNRISGYKIIFSEEEVSNRKFIKMNDDEKQDYLKDRFFSDLTRFAKSNVSLALIYWLLSTRDVDKNRIIVGEFKEPNLSFLNTLSSKKVHVLQALILHDGLTLENLNDVLNEDFYDSSLLLIMLLEDGIIMKKDEYYMVAPLVFRSVVNLLKSKNLIY